MKTIVKILFHVLLIPVYILMFTSLLITMAVVGFFDWLYPEMSAEESYGDYL